MAKVQELDAARALLEALLGEYRYILLSGDIRDSERNSAELRDRVAQQVGYADYAALI